MTIKSIPDDEAHLKIMRLVQTRPTITQREVAGELGVSLGKVNFLLNALIEKGAVKVDNFRRSNNKLAYAYLLTPAGVDDKARLTVSFLKRKLDEYESICKEIDQLNRDARNRTQRYEPDARRDSGISGRGDFRPIAVCRTVSRQRKR